MQEFCTTLLGDCFVLTKLNNFLWCQTKNVHFCGQIPFFLSYFLTVLTSVQAPPFCLSKYYCMFRQHYFLFVCSVKDMYSPTWSAEDLLPSTFNEEGWWTVDSDVWFPSHDQGGWCTVTMARQWRKCVKDCSRISYPFLCLRICECTIIVVNCVLY